MNRQNRPQDSPSRQLLLVEDDEFLQDTLQRYLQPKGFHIHCLSTGEDIARYLSQHLVDLIILDRLLPGKDGLYWLNWLQNQYAYIPVLIASACINEDDRLAGLELGARDYIIKPFHVRELLLRIENILGNDHLAQTGTIRFGALVVDSSSQRLIKRGKHIKLTGLEVAILQCLHLNKNQPVSRENFMQQLRGTAHNPLDRRIDIHINNLRKKLEDDPKCPLYIQTVRGKGYRLCCL